jgi:monovalent cation/hydrogen antiporter
VSQAEVLIAGLLVAVTGLSALARLLSVPYPIVLVIGGAVLGFVPGLPQVELDPDVVLVVFLPPLLYGAAIFANFHDFRAEARWLALNTLPLVLVTMSAVAVTAHLLIPGMPWAPAFALGAIVSPTDPLAAGAIMRRLGAPRRLVSVLEGEGLFNDAAALVAYRVAVTAVVAGSLSLADASLDFVAGAVGGVAIGVAVGWAAAEIRKRAPDDQLNITLSLLTGYAAFLPAQALGASAVLAAVSAGIYMGVRGPRILPVRVRLQGYYVWDTLDFVVNAILFVLIGLQLRNVVDGLPDEPAGTLAGYALVVTGVVVATRLVWFFTTPYAVFAIDPAARESDRGVGARGRLVAAWCGMRGAVSLAVALALPITTDAGQPFPNRDLIIFITFVVILFTLVVQGLSLPVLVRRLGIGGDDTDTQEDLRARLRATKAALARIDDLADEQWTRDDSVQRLRAIYEYRKRRLASRAGRYADDEDYESRSLAWQQMLQLVLVAQREELLRMRHDGQLSNEAMNRILRELDLEETRLEI